MHSNNQGIVEFKFHDRVAKLQYNWAALDKISSDEELKSAVADLGNNVKPSIVGRLFVIGCEALSPDIDYEFLTKNSPPLVKCLSSINDALNLAYFGTINPDGEADSDNGGDKKKTG